MANWVNANTKIVCIAEELKTKIYRCDVFFEDLFGPGISILYFPNGLSLLIDFYFRGDFNSSELLDFLKSINITKSGYSYVIPNMKFSSIKELEQFGLLLGELVKEDANCWEDK